MAKTIQQAGGDTSGSPIQTSQAVTGTTSVQATKTQTGDMLAKDIMGIMGDVGKMIETGYEVSSKAADRVAADSRAQFAFASDAIMSSADETIEGQLDAKKKINAAYHEFGRREFNNAYAQVAFDKGYHDIAALSASKTIGSIDSKVRGKEADATFIAKSASTRADYMKGGMIYTYDVIKEKESGMTKSGDYNALQAQTNLSGIEIEALNDKYKLKKDLDIYVDGSNFELDSDKVVRMYNANFAYSKAQIVPEYDSEDRLIGRKVTFVGSDKSVDSSVVNKERDAFIALIQKAKKNSQKALTAAPKQNTSMGQSSQDINIANATHWKTVQNSNQVSERTGMKKSDSVLAKEVNDQKQGTSAEFRIINYEGAVERIFDPASGAEYSAELRDLKNMKSGYGASHFIDGEEQEEKTYVNTPYAKSDFDIYVKQEINKRESVIADPSVPYSQRELEVTSVALASQKSEGQISTPYIDTMYKDNAEGNIYATTLTEAQAQTDLSLQIGMTLNKSKSTSWMLNPNLKGRADLLLKELKEGVTNGEYKENEALTRYRAFTKTLAYENNQISDSIGTKATTYWVAQQGKDVESWNPASEVMATGTLRLLNYDVLGAVELTEDIAKETVTSQTMMLSNDWFSPTADAVRIKTPAGVSMDKRGGITDKIFAKLAVELKETNIMPDDYESSRMNVSQGSHAGKTYTYVSVTDADGKILAMISLSDKDLARGLTPEEDAASKQITTERKEATLARMNRPSFSGGKKLNTTPQKDTDIIVQKRASQGTSKMGNR